MAEVEAEAVELKLVQLQISTPEKIWERCLISSYVPVLSDLEFYYKQLLGFTDATVEMRVEAIPVEFNASLLPSHEEAPCEFPANDLETTPDEMERRTKYAQFITQLCEMERSRAAFKSLSRTAAAGRGTQKPKYTTALTEEPLHLIGFANDRSITLERRAWVQDVLHELDPEEPAEDPAAALTTTEVSSAPAGWIVTPTITSVRQSMGSRIILDPEIGLKWERLLGTDLYPDLLVVRRLSSKGWSFEDPLSDKLLSTLISWFIASQDSKVENGMTPFIVGMEKELSNILSVLRHVRVGERLLDMEDESNPRVRVHKLIQAVESQCLESSETDKEIQPISASTLHKFLCYAFKASNIPRDAYVTDDKIPLIIERWTRAGYGFKADAKPIIPMWKDLWALVMRGKPSAIKINHFLASMDAWDPMASVTIAGQDRAAIAQEWIRIYVDTQLIRGDTFKVRSVILHDQIRKWCLQYLPESIFGSQLSCVNIGPVITKRGLKATKMKNGRYVLGVKMKSMLGSQEEFGGETAATEEEIRTATFAAEEALKRANTVQFTTVTRDNDDGSKTKQRVVEHTVVEETDGARIEHYFAASVTTETINLGRI
jgi:hypothetical protein